MEQSQSSYIAFIHGQPRSANLLGRFVEHDPRSRAFAVSADATAVKAVRHTRHAPILDQGQLGSCTGNAGIGALSCSPYTRTKRQAAKYNEAAAVELYSAATQRDDVPGAYPPMDTGSSGLAIAKVLYARGVISGYQHAFSIDAVLTALQRVPVLIGTVWLSGMDQPDERGFVSTTGTVQGGHEYLLREYQPSRVSPEDGVLTFDNSWGTGWGLEGRFKMRVSQLRYLLGQQGDATVLLPKAA